jgi:predicted HNH restriction endonuclease
MASPAAQIIIQQCPDRERAAVTTSHGKKRVAPAQLAVLACDRHRCATPGCRSTHFFEVHPVKPGTQGGSNLAETLITLCSRCHDFVHEGG